MEYKKLKPYNLPEERVEEKMRELWYNQYCQSDIETFDGVKVRFYEDMFDHSFYESSDRIKGDKSILSLNRLEKMLWIKDTLQDNKALLKKGWDKVKKKYSNNRRVAIVKGNYVVIIMFTGYLRAKFITAFEKNEIEIILQAPDFERPDKFFKEK
jgi:hypothetical protein